MKLYKFSVVLFLFSYFVLAAIIVLLVYPYKTVDYFGFKILNQVLRPGDKLKMEVDYCRYTDAQTVVSRTLVNDIVYVLPDQIISAPVGCNTSVVEIEIPPGVEPGKYRLESTVSWQVNFLRKITKKLNCGNFTIIK